MPDILTGYTHLVQIRSDWIDKSVHGKWYQLTPRTFIVKADDQFAVVTLNIFQRIGAAFLKIFGVNYFAKILKAKEVTILEAKALMSKENLSARNERHELEKAFCEFTIKKVEAIYNHKKMCLLSSCAPTKVPQKSDETWTWLSSGDAKPNDPNFVRLKIPEQDPNFRYLHNIFDRVVIDCCGIRDWKQMHHLLKNKPEAEIIVLSPATKGFGMKQYNSEDELLKDPIDYEGNAKRAAIMTPWIPAWDDQTRKARQKEAIEKTLVKTEEYLKTLFTTVIFERDKQFPGGRGKDNFFILRGPKAV